jgi:S-(hydroxymethyl)glutathione dehydrogenase/alcohol dehydrogenase
VTQIQNQKDDEGFIKFKKMSSSSITCKAAIAFGPSQDVRIEEIIVAPPSSHEVRVKLNSTAVCHTDLYTLSGQDGEAVWPCILGHEGSGIVESIGEGVTSCQIGDHVILLYIPECRTCKFCKSGKTNLCSIIRVTQGKGLLPDGTTRFSLKKDGSSIFHFMGCSTFSEYTVVADISLAVVNKTAPLEKICLLGCGVTTGYGSVINTAKVEKDAITAVFGLGAVGLAVVAGLKSVGAKRIICIDTNDAKKPLAEFFGGSAVEFINPKTDLPEGKTIQAHLVDITTEDGAGGVDYSFECVGNVNLMRAALEACHKGWGKSIIIGVAAAGQEISTRPFQLVTGRTWMGSAFGGVKGRTELPMYVERYLDGKFELDKFVTHTYTGVEDIGEAIHIMHDASAGALRPVITF